jgi:hypothetical protein
MNKKPVILVKASTWVESIDHLLRIVSGDTEIKLGILEVIQEWVVSIFGSCFCGQAKLFHESRCFQLHQINTIKLQYIKLIKYQTKNNKKNTMQYLKRVEKYSKTKVSDFQLKH